MPTVDQSPQQKLQAKRLAWYNADVLAATPCAECGESLPAKYMQFVYKDGRIDTDNQPKYLAQRGYSQARIMGEVSKGYIFCKWHALEVDYLRKLNALKSERLRQIKELNASYAQDFEQKLRKEWKMGDSLTDTMRKELLSQ